MRRFLGHAVFLAVCSCAAAQVTKSEPAPCPTHEQRCGDRCVDERSDSANCGRCGKACGPGLSCRGGKCLCAAGQEACASGCVDTHTDVAHCGSCNVACAAGELCRDGQCACREGETRCKGACVTLSSDPLDCGACGNSCGPHGTCGDGRCLVTLAESQDNGALAVDGSFVYWRSGNAILKVSVQGGTTVTAATSVQGPPGDLALDASNVYWTIPAVDAVMKTPLGGGPSTVLASKQGTLLKGIAVDATNVYFATQNTQLIDTLFAVPIGGGSAKAVMTTQAHILELAADAGHVFWSQTYGERDGSINFTTAKGGTTALVTGLKDLRSFAVGGSLAAWATTEAIAQAPSSGGSLTVLAPTSFPTALAVGQKSVYWAELPTKGPMRAEIKRVAIEGGEPTILLTPPVAVRALVVGGTSLYWTTSGGLMQLSPI